MLKKNKLALRNLKWASNDLKEFAKNSPHAINGAMYQIESASNYYDGLNGIDMNNLLEILNLTDTSNAIDDLKAGISNNSNDKALQTKFKHDIATLSHSKFKFVILTNSITLNETTKIHFITTNFLQKLIQNMKKAIKSKPYLFKLYAQSGSVNMALRSLTNYLIKINKAYLLRKNHLAERMSINESELLYPRSIQVRFNKVLDKHFGYDMFKVNHLNQPNMSLSVPTINDVNKIVKALA